MLLLKNKVFLTGLLLAALCGLLALFFWPLSLDRIHTQIEHKFDDVKHVNASQFGELDPEQTVIFDVREKEEYLVSHIEGAIQLSPSISPEEFEKYYGDLIEGRQLVFYCSVGRRSSAVASRLGEVTEDLGATSSQNLMGGVFNWANEGRELSSNKVHPYNTYWGNLIKDKDKISYTPKSVTLEKSGKH